MNKTDLVNAVAASTGFTKKDAEKAVTAVIDG
ncbi:MAG TPA: HU family DNA-binding protein, partial [Clostridiales bacterium]|nr:HU family DNA-binding protein [Clostridiales bacterium]